MVAIDKAPPRRTYSPPPSNRALQQERFRDTCLSLKYMANRPDKFPQIVQQSAAVSGCIQLGLWEKEKYQ